MEMLRPAMAYAVVSTTTQLYGPNPKRGEALL